MSIQESITARNASKLLLCTGMGLDLVNKLGQYQIIPLYPLGRGTLLENHIGNFGTSVILTSIVREKVFSKIERQFDIEIPTKIKNFLAFLSIAAINIAVETLKNPNPELVGDVGVGTLASLLYLFSFPNTNITDIDVDYDYSF